MLDCGMHMGYNDEVLLHIYGLFCLYISYTSCVYSIKVTFV